MQAKVRLSFSLLLMTSCKTATRTELKHQLHQPTQHLSHSVWTSPLPEEYPDLIQTVTGQAQSTATLLSDDHAVTLRLQHWVDRLDSILRLRYPNELSAIPKPKIATLLFDEANAIAPYIPLCFDNVHFSLKGDVPKEEQRAKFQVSFIGGLLSTSSANCRRTRASPKQIAEHIKWVNDRSVPCQLTLKAVPSGDYLITPNGQCRFDPSLLSLSDRGARLPYEIFATSNTLFVFSGLLKALSEEEAVAMLYHELGHYYKGHPSNLPGPYRYFYRLNQENQASAPLPDPELKPLTEAFAKLDIQARWLQYAALDVKSRFPTAIYPQIIGQKTETVLAKANFSLTLHLKNKFCTNSTSFAAECHACTDAVQAGNAALKPLLKEEGIIGPLGPGPVRNHLAYEVKMLACFKSVNLVSSKGSPTVKTPDVMSERTVISAFKNNASVDLVERPLVEGTLAAFILSWSQQLKHSGRYTFSLSAYESFRRMQNELRGFESERLAVLRTLEGHTTKAKAESLGFYSGEQEADDLAAEWLTFIGFDPSFASSMTIQLLNFFNPKSADQCRRMQNRAWRDETGRAIVLAWGPLEDDHPESCFRARNIDMEIAAHGYPHAALSPAAQMKPAWTELVSALNQSQGSEPSKVAHASRGVARDDVRRNALLSCRLHVLPEAAYEFGIID